MANIEDRLLEAMREIAQKQTDALFQAMNNLSDRQTKAMTRALNEALKAQSDVVVAALNSYVVRIFNLEREVAALREGRPSDEREPLQ